jgi:hypothetical protein
VRKAGGSGGRQLRKAEKKMRNEREAAKEKGVYI